MLFHLTKLSMIVSSKKHLLSSANYPKPIQIWNGYIYKIYNN